MKNIFPTILLFAILLSACGAAPTVAPPTDAESDAMSAPVVETQSGRVQGTVTDSPVFVFKGIPYAAPPIGELRWKLPQPPVSWTDVRNATEFGAACVQPSSPGIVLTTPPSEDCLTVNIWTPGLDANAKRPVMVWIHGGGFTSGAGSEALYDGRLLAARGAVVVTFNYRLGALGFFSHPALEGETPEGPVNFGWYDQRAALQWVQQNITAFGGNPQNVTIFGESAGAGSVLALFASPLTRGLFQRGIAESFTLSAGRTREQANTDGANFATALGLNGAQATVAELRATPAEKFAGTAGTSDFTIGDSYLPQSILASFENGVEAPLPLIIGSNSDETAFFDLFGVNMSIVPQKFEEAGIPVKELYSDSVDDKNLGRYILRDTFFTMMARHIAEQHSQRAATWRYYFSYLPVNARAAMPGVPHGGELPFVFGTETPAFGAFTPADWEMSGRVMDYWYAFALTGTPEPVGAPTWLPTSAGNDQTMMFGEKIEMQPDFLRKQTDGLLVFLQSPISAWLLMYSCISQ